MSDLKGHFAVDFVKNHLNYTTKNSLSKEELNRRKHKREEVIKAFNSAKEHAVYGAF
jgi:hypothetical protein